MRRIFSLFLPIILCHFLLQAQEDNKIQIHGFVTQGFVFGSANNYLGMNTSEGSLGWTEGALNANDQVTDKLRVGAQFHLTKLGEFGSYSTPSVDWALIDYKFNQRIGVRAGKVKIRWGLFNDTQDADPGYLWSLLPEPAYAVDWRATNLSQMGAELYGKLRLGDKAGELAYSAYYGYFVYASNDGYMEGFKESGLNFTNQPWGITPGFDLRWKTPIRGLMLSGSLMLYNAKGNLTNGAFRQPLTYWPTYYAQYDAGKFRLSWQYVKLVQYNDISTSGMLPYSTLQDTRAWFGMGEYHLTDKLQLGIYYTHYVVASAADQSNPANYCHDWVASSRYDLNRFFYLKLEGHFITGTGVGFYGIDNPNGLDPQTKLLVAKAGFSF
jgi:hypothetical protein